MPWERRLSLTTRCVLSVIVPSLDVGSCDRLGCCFAILHQRSSMGNRVPMQMFHHDKMDGLMFLVRKH